MSSNGAPPPLPTRKPKKHINHNHHTGRHEEKAENGSLENSCQELNLRLESERQRWQYKSQAADIEVQNLKKQYIELEKETRKYQDALGKAKNFHFGDDHISNTVELAKTISDIVVLLEEITTVKGKD
ncbi:6566_t:CDS:2, partial [Scutellospora calospora]